LIAGDFAWPIYESAFSAALRAQRVEVIHLRVRRLFGPGNVLRRAQSKLVFGPGVILARAAFVAACARYKPDVALAWRAPWLSPHAIALARSVSTARIVLYCNDDPFGPDRELPIWRAWRRGVPSADLVLAYRRQNLADLRAVGARSTVLWRSAFDPAIHRPISLTDEDRRRFASDVVFIGHCEDDGRLDMIDHLLRSGLRIGLYGTGWERFARGRAWEQLLPIRRLFADDYAKAICAAKSALVLLSGRNRDQYTRRCFEIPACGTLMLAPRTDELLSLFREEEEAVFWSGPDELVAQARRICSDEALRVRVAAAGRARALRDGHDIHSRAREFLRLCDITQ
jgi:spore maturation protein CgeB